MDNALECPRGPGGEGERENRRRTSFRAYGATWSYRSDRTAIYPPRRLPWRYVDVNKNLILQGIAYVAVISTTYIDEYGGVRREVYSLN